MDQEDVVRDVCLKVTGFLSETVICLYEVIGKSSTGVRCIGRAYGLRLDLDIKTA